MHRFGVFLSLLVLVILSCSSNPTPPPTPRNSIFTAGGIAFGFFPSPPEVELTSVMKLFKDMSAHGDFVLIQQNIAWEDFVDAVEGISQSRTDLLNQANLAHQNNLESIFVIDALNGLNRREFAGLPVAWEASFADPNVRSAFKNYALWIIRQFKPRYLGLASEINTYMDAHPRDAANFLSLYRETYLLVKKEAPNTQVFVTFQWDDLNNMFPQPEEGDRQKFDVNWEQVEAFEPNLDLWAISTYPYFVFPSGAEIPTDYYTPLHSRTDKPLAVAEGGFTSRNTGWINASPEDQAAYLNAIHEQLSPRLVFWVNTLLNDINIDSYAGFMESQGRDPADVDTLGYFAHIGLRESDGTPKPSLELWDLWRDR